MKKVIVSFMMVPALTVLAVSCDSNSASKVYKVVDKGPAGGTIFYVNANAAKDG